MPTGNEHHFDGLQDGPNLTDDNLNSLSAGGCVHPVLGELKVNVEPAIFNSSALVAEVYPGVVGQSVPASSVGVAIYLLPGGPPTLVVDPLGFPVGEHCPLALVDTDSVQVIKFVDYRPKLSSLVGGGPPSGPAGGSLAGTYPTPTLGAGVVSNAEVAALAAIAESKLALNFPTHSNANDPTTDEKAALAGTSGAPSALNKYATDADARLSDARTPTSHAASHQHGGGDEVATATPAANAIPKADGLGKLDNGWINRQVAGDDYQHVVAEARTTTVAGPGAPTLKLQLVVPVLTGTYRIDWQADFDNAGLANPGVVRLYNVTDALVLDQADYAQAIAVGDARRVAGFVELVLAGVGKTIEIQHYDSVGGNTQGIQRARLEIKRVA